ncbi:hypothetical protein IAR50_000945 [Cryptococcus sp. DSM 104548]
MSISTTIPKTMKAWIQDEASFLQYPAFRRVLKHTPEMYMSYNIKPNTAQTGGFEDVTRGLELSKQEETEKKTNRKGNLQNLKQYNPNYKKRDQGPTRNYELPTLTNPALPAPTENRPQTLLPRNVPRPPLLLV